METKFCRKHNNGKGASLPVSSFWPIKTGGTRLQPYCKECTSGNVTKPKRIEEPTTAQQRWRKSHPEQSRKIEREGQARRRAANPEKFKAYWFKRDLMRFYGVTPEWYEQKLQEQCGKCAICGEQPTGKKRLAVDHCHKTGQARGLLCIPCNTALGAIVRTDDWFDKARKFLGYIDPHDQEFAVLKEHILRTGDAYPFIK